MEALQIGIIDVTSDKVIACDPCRRVVDDVWFNTVIKDMLPGQYIAEVTMFDNEDTHGWGDRVAELTIRHKDYSLPEYETTEKITDAYMCVAVDSGQAMFMTLDAFKKILEEKTDKIFYDQACAATETEQKAGIVNNAVISSSGYGDDCYDVYVARNPEGKVVAASIEFLQEGE